MALSLINFRKFITDNKRWFLYDFKRRKSYK